VRCPVEEVGGDVGHGQAEEVAHVEARVVREARGVRDPVQLELAGALQQVVLDATLRK
jgi:hypothetical protein